jgi:hypothetical protein
VTPSGIDPYTESREEYPLDDGDDSARNVPFLLAFLHISFQEPVRGSPFLQAMKALGESRGVALLCF